MRQRRTMASRAYQCIGVDFGLYASFAQNNSKNSAPCDTRTSHPAIAELRTVQHDNIARCEVFMSHRAMFANRTLPLSPIARCDAKRPFWRGNFRASPPVVRISNPAKEYQSTPRPQWSRYHPPKGQMTSFLQKLLSRPAILGLI